MPRNHAAALIIMLAAGTSAISLPAEAVERAGERDRLPQSSADIPVPTERPDSAAPKTPVPEASAPVPEKKPEQPPAADGKAPSEPVPAPDEKPSKPEGAAKPGETEKPDQTGKPAEKAKPDGAAEPQPGSSPPAAETEAPKKEEPEEAKNPPIEAEDEKEYAACLADLKAAGADFSEKPRIDDGNGCGIDKPLVVREILPGIAVKPEATMRCKTALQLNRWTKGSVLPSAELAFGADKTIKAVNQATSYACRNRNSASSGKLSEHARGNGIDIAGFTFSDGSSLTIAPRERDSSMTGAFERAIMATGCLYFTTVLGPGSDAAHETHLHFDVIERKAGYRYCW